MIKLFLLHFIADFLLQSREMGKKKSSEYKWLFGHLAIQFLVFLPFTGWRFSAMNALLHGIIDRNIWNLYRLSINPRLKFNNWRHFCFITEKNEWKYWEDHWFYATIGLDQFLHAATLIYLYNLL